MSSALRGPGRWVRVSQSSSMAPAQLLERLPSSWPNFLDWGPVVAIAGNGREFVESILDHEAGDRVVDYRYCDEATVDGIRAALDGRSVYLAVDAISADSSDEILGKVLDSESGAARMATVLPLKPADDVQSVKISFTKSPLVSGSAEQANGWLGSTVLKLIELAAADGSLKGHPYEVVGGGLNGIEGGLRQLQSGSSTVKFVYELTR